MHSRTLRIIFGTLLVWSLLLGLDLHKVVKMTMQLAHIEHHLISHAESLMDIVECCNHDDSHPISSTDSEHHRHHDKTSQTNCGTNCIAQVAVPPSAVVLPSVAGDDRKQLFAATVDLYTDKPLASIFQPPRA